MESITKRVAGNLGEDEACRFLKKNGYRILERNFTIRGGEIDIICEKGEYVVFVEVKLRKNTNFGTPGEFVGKNKQERLKKAAQAYLLKHPLEKYARFDVVEIIGDTNDGKLNVLKIGVIQNAF